MPFYKGETGYVCSCPDGNCDMSCNMYRLVSNKPSNADKIRAMTDEELADFLQRKMDAAVVRGWKSWLDWLKQEAEHDTE